MTSYRDADALKQAAEEKANAAKDRFNRATSDAEREAAEADEADANQQHDRVNTTDRNEKEWRSGKD